MNYIDVPRMAGVYVRLETLYMYYIIHTMARSSGQDCKNKAVMKFVICHNWRCLQIVDIGEVVMNKIPS